MVYIFEGRGKYALNLNYMKILVTGATGFIGRNFLKTVQGDLNEYICLVRKTSNTDFLRKYPNIVIKESSFGFDELCLLLQDVEIVIHMAGQMGGYGVAVETYERTNCQMTQDIINACKASGIKQFIYLSTPGVQGFGKRLCEEKETYAPRNSYEETKVKAERLILDSLTDSGVKYTILRPDFVYGPGDYRRIKMYKNIRDRKFILTTSGKSYIHPTYVQDVVQGIVCSINNTNAFNEIFNLSADKDLTVREYLETIAEYFHVRVLRIPIGYRLSIMAATVIEKFYNAFLHKEGFVSKNKIDFLALDHSTSNQKAKQLLGFRPQYDFRKGFRKTMEWCEKEQLLNKRN